MDDRLLPIQGIFRSNENLFRAALADVGAVAWLQRSGEANHLAFLAVHLAGARYYIVRFLGGEARDPLERYHEKARSIDDIAEFPPPAEVLAAWDEVAPLLDGTLAEVTPAFLDGDSGLPFPTPGPTRLDALSFLAQHEAYHLGQMCLIRRIHGLAAAEWPRF
ncbi:MAG TPA: DinB family protein [Gemmatimonadota bacterium]|nr:DinB family protein [Gemmatimonadota bacterium]